MHSLYYTLCQGQNIQLKGVTIYSKKVITIDTISVLSFRNELYLNYKILQLYNLEDGGNKINSTNRIELTKENKTIDIIFLPSSEDIKNFSLSKIEETNDGFKIVVNWGGGNYFYGKEFYFKFKNGRFYFNRFQINNCILAPKKETRKTKVVFPPLSINKFNILNYLDNE